MGQPRWGWQASGGFTYRRLKPAATHGWAALGPLVKAYLGAYGALPPATMRIPTWDAERIKYLPAKGGCLMRFSAPYVEQFINFHDPEKQSVSGCPSFRRS